jgi:antitoxin component of RelBE/YafQ-DinJ toxin-antitoxin module
VERMTERLDVRISRADRDAAKAIAKSLGITCSAFTRMSLRERIELEDTIRRNDQKDGETE